MIPIGRAKVIAKANANNTKIKVAGILFKTITNAGICCHHEFPKSNRMTDFKKSNNWIKIGLSNPNLWVKAILSASVA